MPASYPATTKAMLRQLDETPGIEKLRSFPGFQSILEPDALSPIMEEAERFSLERLAPFDRLADEKGCKLERGRVNLAPGHRQLWEAFREAGWAGIDIDARHGGQGLPNAATIPVQEMFDRGSVSFGMAFGSTRSAARLLHSYADPAIIDEWLPRLADGTWGATICISEPDAGSDVGRIRTTANRASPSSWRVTGEKIWISYGDHDLVERIGHLVLARVIGSPPGTRGLSLFLVPSTLSGSAGTPARNKITVHRLEEKLGLHGSPTCALGFEDADAILIGEINRGLPQLFRMIVAMRLSVGTQSLGLTSSCLTAATEYSSQRCQGGPPEHPALPIERHPDVQLMLIRIASRLTTLRGLVYAAAIAADLSEVDDDEAERTRSSLLLGWLLPIIKNSGAETAVDAAREAMLVFGGAGYTTEWPIERHLRDAAILAIYEGTTGMQALDLVRRRWQKAGTGYETFVAYIEEDIANLPDSAASFLREQLKGLAQATAWLRDSIRADDELQSAAREALNVATIVTHGWIAARLSSSTDPQLAACGEYGMSSAAEHLPAALLAMTAGELRTRAYADLAHGR